MSHISIPDQLITNAAPFKNPFNTAFEQTFILDDFDVLFLLYTCAIPEMTYIVSGGMLNPTHSLTYFVAKLG